MVKRAMVRAMSPMASSRLWSRRWSWAPRRHSQPEMAASGVMNRKHTMSQHSVRFSVLGPGSFSHCRGVGELLRGLHTTLPLAPTWEWDLQTLCLPLLTPAMTAGPYRTSLPPGACPRSFLSFKYFLSLGRARAFLPHFTDGETERNRGADSCVQTHNSSYPQSQD